jgi:uncharacterized membrane protein
MTTDPVQSPDPAPAERPDARGAFQVTDTGRVEAFSDGVFAVAITILALEMGTPAHRDGGLLSALLDQWPVYLGYLTSFAYLGVIWLNHHQAFARIRVMDRGLHVANLAVLFIAAALPFPTGVLAHALQERITSADVRTAVALYALIAAALSASWVWIYYQLIRRPGLLEATVDARYVPQGLVRSAVGIVICLLGGVLGWAVNPGIALAMFLLLPLFYFATTEGIPGTRTR